MAVTQTTCYRHTDRPTGLSCTQCGRAICGECSIPGPVGQRCPECHVPQQQAAPVRRRQRGLPPVTRALLIVTVAVSVVGFGMDSLYGSLAQINPAVEAGEWWRLLSASLLHGGIIHLGFNMYALYLLGPTLERSIVGPSGLLGTYVASVAAGGLFAFYFLDTSALIVGASGGISGLIGVFVAFALARRLDALLRQFAFIIGINVVLPFIVPNIAWQAHVGGFLAGALIAGAAFLVPKERQERLLIVGSIAVIAASIVAVL